MMLEYIGEFEAAKRIEKALYKTLNDGISLTKDLKGNATTKEFSDEIIKNLKGE